MPGFKGGGKDSEPKEPSSCTSPQIVEQKAIIRTITSHKMINCIVNACNGNKYNYCHKLYYYYLLMAANKLFLSIFRIGEYNSPGKD